jgi:hypothetical protein
MSTELRTELSKADERTVFYAQIFNRAIKLMKGSILSNNSLLNFKFSDEMNLTSPILSNCELKRKI